jgi:WD40 repeat protein
MEQQQPRYQVRSPRMGIRLFFMFLFSAVAFAVGGSEPTTQKALAGHKMPVSSVALAPAAKHVAAGATDGTIIMWDAQTGQILHTLKAHTGTVRTLMFSPDGLRLASGGSDAMVKIWDVASGELSKTLARHTLAVTSLAYSPDGKTLFSHGDGPVCMWSTSTGELKGRLGPANGSMCMAINAGATRLATITPSEAQVWEIPSGEELATLSRRMRAALHASFSPDSHLLAWGCSDKSVTVWDTRDVNNLKYLDGHDKIVLPVTFSGDGKVIISGSLDGTIRLWDIKSGKSRWTFTGDKVSGQQLFLEPNRKVLAVGIGKTVNLWDMTPFLGQAKNKE